MHPSLSLAKLTAPSPSRVYPREPLFQRLDRACQGPIAWISAPAGAGKTTAVADYLARRGISPLWYHLDAGDGEPAAFFGYLTEAARGASPQAELPAFTAEYLAGLEAFTRNYFRRLFEHARPRRVLVFDDYHELPPDSPLHQVFRQGLEEIPPGLTVIVVSRNDPPPALARLRTQDGFSLIGRDQLLLSAAETAGIGRLRTDSRVDPALLERLHQRTHGWVAGLVLLLEQARAQGGLDPDRADQTLVFDYLAGEVFQRMGAEEQALLLATALLPDMTAQAAAELSGIASAGERLEALYRRNYFTVRHSRGDAPPSYEYHPLFRQFLLATARQRLPAAELTALKRRAAELLARDGAPDAAAALLRETGDWPLLARLIRQHAPALLAGGRYGSLQAWLEALPQETLSGDPWLQYYLGMARLPFDLAQARAWFERSYRGFKAAGEREGQALAWAGAVDTFLYHWGEFRSADRWIGEFDSLTGPGLSPSTDVRLTAGIFAILMYRQPDHPRLPHWTRRLEQLLFEDIDPLLRMHAANHLVTYHSWWTGDLGRAADLLARLESVVDADDSLPVQRIAWLASRAIHLWMSGEIDACRAAAREGLTLAARHGVHLWDPMLIGQTVWASLTSGELDAAEDLIRQLRARLAPARHLHGCQFEYLCYSLAGARGDAEAVDRHSAAALEQARTAGVAWAESIMLITRAQALRRTGADGWEDYLREAEAIAQRMASSTAAAGVYKTRAEIALEDGDQAGLLHWLGLLFGLMRRQRLANSSWWQNTRMAPLCAQALAHGIETDYVRHLIRLRAMAPPADAPEHWPWPVRIHTLGHFQILLDDQPLAFGPKVQKKPLELLKALIASGGRQVPEAILAEALWPDADGDAAHNAFVTTLQRLRKLLGGNEFLSLRDGRLSLDDRRCWIDAWAFEGQPRLDLYHGPFLAGDEDAPFAAPLRERLRRLYLRELLERGRAYEAEGRWAEAAGLYEQGIRAEETAEELYQRLMLCCVALNRRSEGMAAYQACRQVMADRLGLSPSAVTEDIHRQVVGQGPMSFT